MAASIDANDAKRYTRQLYEIASAFEVDSSVPIKRYYRSGAEMERQARAYDKEGNLEKAYIIYTKFCILFLEKIRRHPDFAQAPPPDKARVKKLLKSVLPRAEELKEELTDLQQARINALLKKKAEAEEAQAKEEEVQKRQAALLAESSGLPAAFSAVQSQPAPHGPAPLPTPCTWQHAPYQPMDSSKGVPMVEPHPSAPSTVEEWGTPLPLEPSPPNRTQASYPSLSELEHLAVPGGIPHPVVDRSTKPSTSYTSLQTDIDWAGEGLRRVLVPADVDREFLARASSNTRRNIETCGILAGQLVGGLLKMTHVIIPKQSGTANSCDTQKEEEIFDALDREDLITLGWIHTHPSQTSFMSSIDLHTHCSYQLMMPEAVSIVVAPKYGEVGFFTLTKPYGLEHIASCRKPGFHPHPKDPPLYENCSHVTRDPLLAVKVTDLR